jgi:hypothetical protein
MGFRYHSSLFRAALALVFLLVLAACTPGGQFDPTEVFNSDMFDSKTKLTGPRQPLFPNGVPGTATGVPADLVKGYQPPPDQTDANANAPGPPVPTAQAAKPQEKPKPKAQVAVARPRKPARVERPPASTPTRIDIGAKGAPAQQPAQANWPNSPPSAPAQQGGQIAWPSPSQTAPTQQPAQPSQSAWPAAPAQQAGQSPQPVWPNPPATGTSTQ